jgi:hypothetical protein
VGWSGRACPFAARAVPRAVPEMKQRATALLDLASSLHHIHPAYNNTTTTPITPPIFLYHSHTGHGHLPPTLRHSLSCCAGRAFIHRRHVRNITTPKVSSAFHNVGRRQRDQDPPQEECEEGNPVLPHGLRCLGHWKDNLRQHSLRPSRA